MGVTHTFQTAKSDGTDATLVQGTYWNAAHTIADGTAGLPGLTPTSDATKGFTFNTTNEIGVSVAGVEVGDWSNVRNKDYNPRVIETGGASSTSYANYILSGVSSVNNYNQIAMQNTHTGTAASSDLVVTCTAGTDGANYLDMGVNGSGFTSTAWTINTANDGYIYMDGYNLALGTDTAGKSVIIFTGGTLAANARITITDSLVTHTEPSSFTDTTDSTSGSTGSVYSSGGMGVAKSLYVASAATVVGPIVQVATAASTTDGALWNDTTQKGHGKYNSQTKTILPGTLWTKTAPTTLASFTSAATIIGAASTGVGTLTLGTAALVIGKSVWIKMMGVIGSSAAAPTATLTLTLGGTSVATTGSITIPASLSNRGWVAEFMFTCKATGASGYVQGEGFWQIGTAAAGGGVMFPTNTTATAAANTTGALAIDVTLACGTSSAANTCSAYNVFVVVMN